MKTGQFPAIKLPVLSEVAHEWPPDTPEDFKIMFSKIKMQLNRFDWTETTQTANTEEETESQVVD